MKNPNILGRRETTANHCILKVEKILSIEPMVDIAPSPQYVEVNIGAIIFSLYHHLAMGGVGDWGGASRSSYH